MQIKKLVLLSFISSIIGIGLNANEMKFINAEIFENMCSKCHGKTAQGNPNKSAPALNNQTVHELEISLYDLKAGGLNQSSGTDHEIMAHNMKKILSKGINFEPKQMAEYIFINFNPTGKFHKKTSNKNQNYSVSQIYENTCSKCHGKNAQGNPNKNAPALNTMTEHEIEAELLDIQNTEMNQSSGSTHEVMEHNQKMIIKKGMTYKAEDMAKYIASHFYKK